MDLEHFKTWIEGYLQAKVGTTFNHDDLFTIMRNISLMVLIEEPNRIEEIVPIEDTMEQYNPSKPILSMQESKRN